MGAVGAATFWVMETAHEKAGVGQNAGNCGVDPSLVQWA